MSHVQSHITVALNINYKANMFAGQQTEVLTGYANNPLNVSNKLNGPNII